MADITTQEKFLRVQKVMLSGRKMDGTKADIEAVSDLMVLMYDPENPGYPREVQMRHATDYINRKGFVIGEPPKVVKPAKKQSKKEIEAERAILEKEAGGSAEGRLAHKD